MVSTRFDATPFIYNTRARTSYQRYNHYTLTRSFTTDIMRMFYKLATLCTVNLKRKFVSLMIMGTSLMLVLFIMQYIRHNRKVSRSAKDSTKDIEIAPAKLPLALPLSRNYKVAVTTEPDTNGTNSSCAQCRTNITHSLLKLKPNSLLKLKPISNGTRLSSIPELKNNNTANKDTTRLLYTDIRKSFPDPDDWQTVDADISYVYAAHLHPNSDHNASIIQILGSLRKWEYEDKNSSHQKMLQCKLWNWPRGAHEPTVAVTRVEKIILHYGVKHM